MRFQQNPNWSQDYIEDLAALLDLGPQKIYKWNWDRKQKELSK